MVKDFETAKHRAVDLDGHAIVGSILVNSPSRSCHGVVAKSPLTTAQVNEGFENAKRKQKIKN